jgi:methionine-gamma-lyase
MQKIDFKNKLGFSSTAIHGATNNNNENAHLVPIYATSTFTFDSAEDGMQKFENQDKQNIYSRWGNPTCQAAQQIIEALEAHNILDDNGQQLQLKALLHSSGQAAMATLFLSNLQKGDTILTHFSLYGGTYELMHKVMQDTGIGTIVIDMTQLDAIEIALQNNATIKLIHLETPANPTIQCVDIEAITIIAKKYNCIVSVDNTFATPYLQQPFKYGVDFVFHSTTKYLNGHGTAIGGVLIGKNNELMATKVWKWFALLGGNSNPFDAFLLLIGLKTLELRMQKHCENAMKVAMFLNTHPKIEFVNYNGLSSHKGYEISKKQMKHPGPMLSFEIKGGFEAAKIFINNLQLCIKAVSLGTVDTLVSHPASSTHCSVPREERLKFGITDGLIRISVGIENIEDIINDLSCSLSTF